MGTYYTSYSASYSMFHVEHFVGIFPTMKAAQAAAKKAVLEAIDKHNSALDAVPVAAQPVSLGGDPVMDSLLSGDISGAMEQMEASVKGEYIDGLPVKITYGVDIFD